MSQKEYDRLTEYLEAEFYQNLYSANFEVCESLLDSAREYSIDVTVLEEELQAWNPKEYVAEED